MEPRFSAGSAEHWAPSGHPVSCFYDFVVRYHYFTTEKETSAAGDVTGTEQQYTFNLSSIIPGTIYTCPTPPLYPLKKLIGGYSGQYVMLSNGRLMLGNPLIIFLNLSSITPVTLVPLKQNWFAMQGA